MTDTELQELVTFRLLGERWYEDISYEHPFYRYLVERFDGTSAHVDIYGGWNEGTGNYLREHRDDFIQIPKPEFIKP